MAVRLTAASSQALYRTANLPTMSAYSVCGWFRRQSDTDTYQSFLMIGDAAPTGADYHVVETSPDGNNLDVYGDGSAATSLITTLPVGSWFFVGMRCNGTNVRGFYRALGTNAMTMVNATGLVTPTTGQLVVGNWDFNSPSDDLDGRAQNVKCWDRALSDAEMLIESFYARVMFPASINFHWPLDRHTVTRDLSGNGRDPTVLNGALTTEDGIGLWVPSSKVIYLPSAGGGGVVNTISADDAATFVDDIQKFVNRNRDATVGFAPGDSFQSYMHRNRDGLSGVVFSEGPTESYTIYSLIADETIVAVDEALLHIVRNRLGSDGSTVLVDDFVSSVVGQNIINAVATDVFLSNDAVAYYMERNREGQDLSVIVDVATLSALRQAVVGSAAQLVDEALRQLQFFVQLTDAFDVVDSIAALYTTPTLHDGGDIEIGVDQPHIVLGGYSV